MFFEQMLGVCNALEGRLDRLEAEMRAPAALNDTATSTATPVVGSQGAELEKALEEGFSDGWRY
jgi:hypothetical protein